MFDLLKKLRGLRNSRRFKRVQASYLVKYQVRGKGEPRITNARDLSAGGLRFWSQEVPETAVLNLSVYLPPLERTVEALAQVLRIRRVKGEGLTYFVAVAFLDLKREDREAINQFAEELSHDSGAKFVIDHADIVVRGR